MLTFPSLSHCGAFSFYFPSVQTVENFIKYPHEEQNLLFPFGCCVFQDALFPGGKTRANEINFSCFSPSFLFVHALFKLLEKLLLRKWQCGGGEEGALYRFVVFFLCWKRGGLANFYCSLLFFYSERKFSTLAYFFFLAGCKNIHGMKAN